jgi:hypothetical protein
MMRSFVFRYAEDGVFSLTPNFSWVVMVNASGFNRFNGFFRRGRTASASGP